MKGGNAFLLNESQFASKKLKDRKKEYLKRKKEKKAVKTASGAPLVEKELQLRDKVKFGEVSGPGFGLWEVSRFASWLCRCGGMVA